MTAPLRPTTSAPDTAATTDAWSAPSLSTDGETKSDPSIVVSESITLSPPAMPMIRPVSATSTDSRRPAPVSGNPNRTSSIAEAIERPGSIATMPPATMNAKSCSSIGRPTATVAA